MAKVIETTEDKVTVDDEKEFVTAGNPQPGSVNEPAYLIKGMDDYVIAIQKGTPLMPTLRDENGDKLDPATKVTLQKADKQGNPLGNAIVFDATLDQFRYDKMGSDTDFFRYTQEPVVLRANQQLHLYAVVPNGQPAFDPGQSRLQIGDNTSSIGKPCFIRQVDDLDAKHQAALKQMNQGGK